jgi:tetratricopeptide (TPR) repeat protein
MNHSNLNSGPFLCAVLALFLLLPRPAGAQSGAADKAVLRPADTNAEMAASMAAAAFLQLQEKLQATQLALERNRKETEEAMARNAELMASRLQTMEQSLAAQRSRELEIVQNFNRAILTLAGALAAVGMVVLLGMAYFQWQTIKRLTEISAGLPTARALGAPRSFAALTAGESAFVASGPVEQVNVRLHSALEQLERRIGELEHPAHAPLKAEPVEEPGPSQATSNGGSGKGSAHTTRNGHSNSDGARIKVLLGKGQSLLSLNQAAEAVACFDAVLSMEPAHGEALLKKGMALEKLERADEALACYDQAAAADPSLKLAYLQKAGLLNRLERFSEALESYELALEKNGKG